MTQADVPAHASTLVIGGGIMGCSTLYHLAKAGVSDAVLLERNQLTSGTTWHSAAQVRALRSSRNLTELIGTSIALYSTLEQETGQATGWINKGSLSIATTRDRMIHIERQAGLARIYGVEATVIGRDEARARWPLMNAEDVIGAVWSPGDGRVSSSDLSAALIKGAKARGARVFEETGVTAILTKGGRVTGVETTRGQIRCDALVLCTGLWSRDAGAMAGVDLPIWPCEHFYLLTKPVPGVEGNMPTLSDHDGHLYIRDDSGGLLVGCFEPEAKAISAARIGPDFAFQLLPEDWDHFEPMMRNALHRLPALENAEVKMLLNGPESFTPDGSFILGEAPGTGGLYLGCGMNSVGVASAGGAGMALAEIITTGQAPFDLSELHPARFPEGAFDAPALSARVPEVLGKHYEIAYPGRQWTSARGLRPHPLQGRMAQAGARFGQVFGWERPLVYGAPSMAPTFGRPSWFDQVAREVHAAHTGAALFDLTPFGIVDVEGPDALDLLEHVCANAVDRPVGRVIYTQMLNARGGIESDLTVSRLGAEHYRLSTGTGAVRRDLAWLARHRGSRNVTLTDRTEEIATLALMGPEAAAILIGLGAAEALNLGYFQAGETEIGGIAARAARLSYVGERGWEISCAMTDLPAMWDLLTGRGAVPAGLHAQSAMRIEKGFLSHGHDIDSDLTPLEAGLDFAVSWEHDFLGRDALLVARELGTARRIVSLRLTDSESCPIGEEPVLRGATIIGKTTSAAFGHRIGVPVAIACIERGIDLRADERVKIEIAGKPHEAVVLAGAAFDPEGRILRGV